jgi:MFS superfamily sulfate permease-like transporter
MSKHKLTPYKLRQDLLASFVVLFVALPLSLGIAIASGTPPVSAIVAAIVGGIVVGLLSGSPVVITGPAAGLSAMILQYVHMYGIQRLFQLTIIAGLIQICFAATRSGKLIQKLPKTVLEGVLSAIGLIIIIGQLHILFGQSIPGGSLLNFLQLPLTISALFTPPANMASRSAFAIGILAILILMNWKKIAGRFQWIPAALPAVIITTIASTLFDMPRLMVSPIGNHISEAIANIWTISLWHGSTNLFGPAIALALVASAESLLTTKSIDVLASKHHLNTKIDPNRELLAQGVGNMVSGFFGGLPLSGVMIRSAANLDAGARTRLSSIFHSIWIAGFIIFAPELLSAIPLSALAAILIVTGVKLVNLPHMWEAFSSNPKESWVWPATAVATVATDLLVGLALGLLFATLNFYAIKLTDK